MREDQEEEEEEEEELVEEREEEEEERDASLDDKGREIKAARAGWQHLDAARVRSRAMTTPRRVVDGGGRRLARTVVVFVLPRLCPAIPPSPGQQHRDPCLPACW